MPLKNDTDMLMDASLARAAVLMAAALISTGCATIRQTDPAQTATQQLLVSSAIDRAVEQIDLQLPADSRVFVDTQYVDTDGISYPKYTIAAVRDRLLKLGARLVPQREQAQIVVELRSGAQSINNKNALVGIPSIPVPVPFAGNFEIPEIALFKIDRQDGIAKVAITAYNAADGSLISAEGPQYGRSKQSRWVLLFLSHTSQDLVPKPGGSPPRSEAK